MKRAALLVMVALAAGFAAGCERNDAAGSYDPQVDGVNPPKAKPVDLTILENQRELAAKLGGSGGGSAVSTPAPATTAAAPEATTGVAPPPAPPAGDTTTAPAAPAAPPAGGDTPPTPPPG